MAAIQIAGGGARRISRLAALLAVSAALQPAQAYRPATEREGLVAMHALADCTVKRHRDAAMRMLAYLPESKESVQAFLATDPSSCMSAENDGDALAMKDHFLRGALAERLLLQDFPAIGVFAGKKLPPVFAWPDQRAFVALKSKAKLDLTLIRIGECATEAAPDKVYALFGTPVGTIAEAGMIQSLVPVLRSCVLQGNSVELKLATVRAYIAEGAYRVSVRRASGDRGGQ